MEKRVGWVGQSGGALRRRGLLAGAAASVAAVLAKASERPVLAAHEGALYIGFENHAEHPTSLIKDAGAAEFALTVENRVAGGSGIAASANGTGVRGESTSSYGIFGQSQSGVGVFGGSNANIGVYANSNQTTGVFATAPQKGVWGRTTTGLGVFGQATATGGYGVYGAAPRVANTWAGYFEGNVFISGTLAGGGLTTAAPAPDGSLRTLYAMDSAEPVVEDFGSGKLANGLAEVRLDQEFAAVVTSDAYMVFLTEEGDHNALFVEKKTPAGFTVRAKGSPTASSAFHYRVVAKRKGAAGKRLEKVAPPRKLDPRELEPPKLPTVTTTEPERPTPGDRPGRPDPR